MIHEDPWLQGFACALANLHRLHHHAGDIVDVLTATGITIEKLRTGGVEAYDLNELETCIARKRKP